MRRWEGNLVETHQGHISTLSNHLEEIFRVVGLSFSSPGLDRRKKNGVEEGERNFEQTIYRCTRRRGREFYKPVLAGRPRRERREEKVIGTNEIGKILGEIG